jgi:3-methylfumaryl-CoA hydratase
MKKVDIHELRQWVGRSESTSERLGATPARLLAATLDAHNPDLQDGMELPPLFHWLYFLQACPQSGIGQDGHPARGGFLPPIPLPRRMWAAGSMEFGRPLRIGETVTRVSTIIDITAKQGHSGTLVFVKLQHVIADAAGHVVLTELQDLVYRAPAPGPAVTEDATRQVAAAAEEPRWSRTVQPDSTLLFRYSALTFNAHRIHYDRRYATETEGYPALVVHGPLVATLLVDQLLRELPHARLRHFEFRAERPLFDDGPFTLCAQPEDEPAQIRLWSRNAAGLRCLHGTATLDQATLQPIREHYLAR